jgi:predicted nucleotidyltransferase
MSLPGYKVGEEFLPEPYRRLIKGLLNALLSRWGDNLVSLVVYGSVARGEARRDSDVDLVIVGRNLPKSRFKRLELFEDAESSIEDLVNELWLRGYHFDFSPIILSVDEARRHRPLYLDLVLDAVIVFDRDSFFAGILDGLAARLRELGAERRLVGKRWYWVLKKSYRFGEVIEL